MLFFITHVLLCVPSPFSWQISKWDSAKNTYGWARAEVLGATINSVFLIALCFTIFVEAIQRMIHDDHIHNPDWMLWVGVAGLAVNLVGLLLFSHHSHGHGGSHGERLVLIPGSYVNCPGNFPCQARKYIVVMGIFFFFFSSHYMSIILKGFISNLLFLSTSFTIQCEYD